jgi:polygalacturonase
MQEMKDATANPSAAPADLQTLNQKVGDATYGSQLSKEAADNYATLVQDALENGARTSAARVDYTAQYEVGINIINGQPTKNYTMFFSNAYGGWHIFPR